MYLSLVSWLSCSFLRLSTCSLMLANQLPGARGYWSLENVPLKFFSYCTCAWWPGCPAALSDCPPAGWCWPTARGEWSLESVSLKFFCYVPELGILAVLQLSKAVHMLGGVGQPHCLPTRGGAYFCLKRHYHVMTKIFFISQDIFCWIKTKCFLSLEVDTNSFWAICHQKKHIFIIFKLFSSGNWPIHLEWRTKKDFNKVVCNCCLAVSCKKYNRTRLQPFRQWRVYLETEKMTNSFFAILSARPIKQRRLSYGTYTRTLRDSKNQYSL